MSKFYKPLTISYKHKNLQWINLQVAVHDQHCQCDEPLKHIIIGILEQEPTIKFTEDESKIIEKCLTTGGPTDHTGDDGDVLGDGELERLFEEDVFGDQEDTG